VGWWSRCIRNRSIYGNSYTEYNDIDIGGIQWNWHYIVERFITKFGSYRKLQWYWCKYAYREGTNYTTGFDRIYI
jgi:hypothetical protein